jgi:hypothetical protein
LISADSLSVYNSVLIPQIRPHLWVPNAFTNVDQPAETSIMTGTISLSLSWPAPRSQCIPGIDGRNSTVDVRLCQQA